jgi:hypothetical protein
MATMAEIEDGWPECREALAKIAAAVTVSMEQAARNWEANLPALREALGVCSMQELGERLTELHSTLTSGLDESLSRFRQLETEKEGHDGTQDQ